MPFDQTGHLAVFYILCHEVSQGEKEDPLVDEKRYREQNFLSRDRQGMGAETALWFSTRDSGQQYKGRELAERKRLSALDYTLVIKEYEVD